MRTASTLVGLTLIALGAGARAEDLATPAAAPPAGEIAAPAAPETAASEPVAPVGAPLAAAGIVAPAPVPRPRRIEVGLSFLPMALGRLTTPISAVETTGDASFAYGVGLSASYRVIAGLDLGLAPQAIFNVNYKVNPTQLAAPPASKQYDLMARVAYEFPIVDGITLYAEALPGYSIISLPGTAAAKGFVLALGGGAVIDMTDRIFVNMGVGYQWGFQQVSVADTNLDNKTRYLRVALGGGARF